MCPLLEKSPMILLIKRKREQGMFHGKGSYPKSRVTRYKWTQSTYTFHHCIEEQIWLPEEQLVTFLQSPCKQAALDASMKNIGRAFSWQLGMWPLGCWYQRDKQVSFGSHLRNNISYLVNSILSLKNYSDKILETYFAEYMQIPSACFILRRNFVFS